MTYPCGQSPCRTSMTQAAARAHSNIALIKYWGKRSVAGNLPAVGSISITLDELFTDTTVVFDATLAADQVVLDHRLVEPARASAFLDLIRARAGLDMHASITTTNNFPTGAGLASSAS